MDRGLQQQLGLGQKRLHLSGSKFRPIKFTVRNSSHATPLYYERGTFKLTELSSVRALTPLIGPESNFNALRQRHVHIGLQWPGALTGASATENDRQGPSRFWFER